MLVILSQRARQEGTAEAMRKRGVIETEIAARIVEILEEGRLQPFASEKIEHVHLLWCEVKRARQGKEGQRNWPLPDTRRNHYPLIKDLAVHLVLGLRLSRRKEEG